MIERTQRTRAIHVTVGYLIARLREYPDLAQHLTPPMTAEAAIAELSKRDPGGLVQCGDESCPVCR
jgi:hypothetical protein